jgi:hypothetical protein
MHGFHIFLSDLGAASHSRLRQTLLAVINLKQSSFQGSIATSTTLGHSNSLVPPSWLPSPSRVGRAGDPPGYLFVNLFDAENPLAPKGKLTCSSATAFGI